MPLVVHSLSARALPEVLLVDWEQKMEEDWGPTFVALNIPPEQIKELAPQLLPNKDAEIITYCTNTR